MPKKYAFTQRNVDQSPDEPGVYALFDGDELIYYGSSETSIRVRLQRHLAGQEGACTASATFFACEPCSNPVQREAALLAEYKRAHGKLPRCNEQMPKP